MQVEAAVFDAYGTLLDVHAAMAKHAARIGPDWQRVSQEWRVKQLEDTWVRSLAGPAHHRDFFALRARRSISWPSRTASPTGYCLRISSTHTGSFRPTPRCRERWSGSRRRGDRGAVLSNGEPGMLDRRGAGGAGSAACWTTVLSVDRSACSSRPRPSTGSRRTGSSSRRIA